MTLSEVKRAVSQLAPGEQAELAAWLLERRHRDDSELLAELARRRDAGEWVCLDDVEKESGRLGAEGV